MGDLLSLERQDAPAPPAAAEQVTRLRVLLVEDNPDDAELIRLAMRNAGCELTVAERLSQAFERLATSQFDVVLLDLSLPDSHGLETFQRLAPRARDVAVLVLTGHRDEALGLRTVHEGAQDYLVKGSVERSGLMRAIRYAIERKRASDEALRVARALAERSAQMELELAMAREVQKAFLPANVPPAPVAGQPLEALRFAHRYLPTGAVSGDYFDVLPISPGRAGVLICDVMGHGVCAALVTAMLRTLVDGLHGAAENPTELLGELNRKLRALLREVQLQMFVSAAYLLVDVGAGRVSFANAGHPAPFVVRTESGAVEALSVRKGGSALGLLDHPSYATCETVVAPGDRFVLFTDGIYEAEAPDGDSWGLERLRASIARHRAAPGVELLDQVLTDARQFSGAFAFQDDVCLLGVELAALSL